MKAKDATELIDSAARGLVAQLPPGSESFTVLRRSIDRGLARLDELGGAIVNEGASSTAEAKAQLEMFVSGVIQVGAAAHAMLTTLPIPREMIGAFRAVKTPRRGD